MDIFGVPLFSLPQAQNMDTQIHFGLFSCFLWYRAFHSLGLLFFLSCCWPFSYTCGFMVISSSCVETPCFSMTWAPWLFSWGGLGSWGGLPHNSRSGFSAQRGGQNLLREKSAYLQPDVPSFAVSTSPKPREQPEGTVFAFAQIYEALSVSKLTGPSS